MLILSALLGLALCLFNASGAEIFCVTEGCSIYAGYSLFGLSFYVLGAGGFAVILLLALGSRKSESARSLLYGVLLIGLVVDMFLLVWQLLYWPCSSCLVVAVLLGSAGVGFLIRFGPLRRGLLKGALLVWLVLLIPSIVSVGKEVLVSPWAIFAAPGADIEVFFSPTCPACSSEVAKLLNSAEADRLAFYPVAKNERDVLLIAAFMRRGMSGTQDLEKLFHSEPDPDVHPSFELRWRLARNKMTLARFGAKSIPFIVSPSVVGTPKPSAGLLSPQPNPFGGYGSQGCDLFGPADLTCE